MSISTYLMHHCIRLLYFVLLFSCRTITLWWLFALATAQALCTSTFANTFLLEHLFSICILIHFGVFLFAISTA